jgi:CHAT domain-containing protein/tetratricopeptide (TPR) repeat protein
MILRNACCCLVIACCASTGQLFAQAINSVLEEADLAIRQRHFDRAIAICKKVITDADSTRDRETWIAALNLIGFAYVKVREYDLAKPVLEKALSNGIKFLSNDNPLTSDSHYYLGVYFDLKGKADESVAHHVEALRIREKIFPATHKKIGESNKGLGEVYFFTLQDFKKANEHFAKAIWIAENQWPKDPYELYSCYYNLARVNRRMGDFDRALTVAFKAFQIINDNSAYHNYLEKCYSLIGDIYYSKTDYHQSVGFQQKGIQRSIETDGRDNYGLILKYTNLGVAYTELRDFAGAIRCFRESLRIHKKHEHQTAALLRNNFVFFGRAYQKAEKLDSAKFYLRKALKVQLADGGFKSSLTSEIFDYLASVFKQHGQLDSAAFYAQQSLRAAIDGFDQSDPQQNPEVSLIKNRYELFRKFGTKGEILLSSYVANMKNQRVLDGAMSAFRIADQLMEMNRNIYQREESKLFFADHYRSIYEKAIETAFLLFEATQDETYRNDAWMFMEKNKAFLLAESLHRAEMFSGAGIPDSIRQEERNIVSQLARCRNELEGLKSNNDINTQEKIQAELFALTQRQESLMTSISQRYPNYFHVKYTSPASLSDIARVAAKKDAIVLQYFWSELFVYAIAVSENNVVIRKIENSPRVRSAIELYSGEMQPGASGGKHDYNTFVTNAELLFRTLVMPLISDYNGERVIVIRDGPLLTIPFESLLLSNRGTSNNYKTLDYLIRKYTISYAHSGNLFVRNAEGKKRSARNGVLGFSFSSSLPNEIQEEPLEENELPGTVRELKAIAEYFQGDYFQGADATEQKFKTLAGDYDILHLAVHGKVDEDKPLGGSLLFKHSLDTVDNGELNLAELYNLKLNARLAVLSACESGVGKVFKGEGVFSISRGFDYAGCPSSIITLWKIGDQASSTIMANFYEELRSGEQIDVALRNAKLRYLETSHSLLTHPTYWAAFVPVGNMDAVQESKLALWAILAAVVLTLSALIVMKKVQARRKQSEMRKREMAHHT